VLDERRDIIELREPGVAACPRCGALHGSDARFCPQCGTQFSGPLAMVEIGDAPRPAPTAGPHAPTAQQPAVVSDAVPGPTPVSGALEGNPPPEPPPAPAPEPAPASAEPAVAENGAGERAGEAPPGAAPEAAAADAVQPTTVQPPAGRPAAGQPTQAFPAAGGEQAGNGDRSTVTSGDPLAQRERPEA
jgi:ribosomal protein L40E